MVPVEAFLKAYKYLLLDSQLLLWGTISTISCSDWNVYCTKSVWFWTILIFDMMEWFSKNQQFSFDVKRRRKSFMVSEVWPELSKEPLFCGFCQKALFEERYIYYSAITIIISKQTAIYTELYFISYSTYISNKLGMFFWLVWTVSTRFCGLCFWQAMIVEINCLIRGTHLLKNCDIQKRQLLKKYLLDRFIQLRMWWTCKNWACLCSLLDKCLSARCGGIEDCSAFSPGGPIG